MSGRGRRNRRDEISRPRSEAEGLRELDRAREPLLRELEVLASEPGYHGGEPPHVCCLRPRNMMTITPLETAAVVRALRTKPALRQALPGILARTRRELARLAGNGKREPFDCPLLEGRRCLVHDHAKPIGCLGWHPPAEGSETRESSYTSAGWDAVRRRNALNDDVYGRGWAERPIPLALAGALAAEPARTRGRGRGSL